MSWLSCALVSYMQLIYYDYVIAKRVACNKQKPCESLSLSSFHCVQTVDMVQCPICATNVSLERINDHLDECEFGVKKEESDERNEDIPKPSKVIEIEDVEDAVEDTSFKSDKNEHQPPKKKMKSALELAQKLSIGDILGTQGQKKKRDSSSISPSITRNNGTMASPKQEQDSSSVKTVPTNGNDYVIPIQSQSDEIKTLRTDFHKPLAERLRPDSLQKYIGQQHLLGPDGILKNLIISNDLPSMILWGPPGVGKTTLARIISKYHKENKFIELNATNSGTAQLRTIFENSIKELRLTNRKTIIFIDEIHRFNKSQQDVFLPFIESGSIKVIGATTENPSFQLNNALLSRCRVFQLEKLTTEDIRTLVNRGILYLNKVRKLVLNQPLLHLEKPTIDHISSVCNGDSRIALNILELINSFFKTPDSNTKIKIEQIKPILAKLPTLYDRSGDFHYDSISALHKSIRGSNVNAALWYLSIMLKNGEDPLYIARRLIRIASEDIGAADDSCLPFAISTYQAIQFVGLPEADLALVQCVAKFAAAKKSVKIYRAWKEIKQMMNGGLQEQGITNGMDIPLHLKNAPTKLMKEMNYGQGYKYNPDFKDGEVKQNYFSNEFLEGYDFFGRANHLGEYKDPDL